MYKWRNLQSLFWLCKKLDSKWTNRRTKKKKKKKNKKKKKFDTTSHHRSMTWKSHLFKLGTSFMSWSWSFCNYCLGVIIFLHIATKRHGIICFLLCSCLIKAYPIMYFSLNYLLIGYLVLIVQHCIIYLLWPKN